MVNLCITPAASCAAELCSETEQNWVRDFINSRGSSDGGCLDFELALVPFRARENDVAWLLLAFK